MTTTMIHLTPDLLAWPLFRKPERVSVLMAMLLDGDSREDTDIPPERIAWLTGLSLPTVLHSLEEIAAFPPPMDFREPKDSKDSKDSSVSSDSRPNTPDPIPAEGLTPPTVEEVEEYLFLKGYTDVDAAQFVAFYEADNWMYGRHKNIPIKNWKLAIANWRKKNKKYGTRKRNFPNDYDSQRAIARGLYFSAESASAVNVDQQSTIEAEGQTGSRLAQLLSSVQEE